MPPTRSSKSLALLCAWLLACAPLVRAQEATRPRRVPNSSVNETASQPPSTAITTTRLETEPTIRIGLATAARSVTISTAAPALAVSTGPSDSAAPQTLNAARVRIEPRMLGPLPTENANELFRVEIAVVESAATADALARDVRALTGDEPNVVRDTASGAWGVRVGPPVTQDEAADLRLRLEEAGFAAVSVVSTTTGAAVTKKPLDTHATPGGNMRAQNSTSTRDSARPNISPRTPDNTRNSNVNGNVRLAARVSQPTRGLVVYAAGAGALMDARAPVMFSSPDEQTAPVRFNEKPYRGRIEVFTNLNGSLTVVNAIGLEDYVRGVVPNELSPGGWPAIEALKAQAVAARTYAVSHRGQFAAAGYDLLPTTRSQVYGGMSTEHPLTTRAVAETRGIIATYQGAPINALYTSTCGGRTEDAEQIFGGALVPYLRGRECTETSAQALASFAPFTLQTDREPAALRTAEHINSARQMALLAVHGFRAASRLTDEWLDAPLTSDEAHALIELVARLAHKPTPVSTNDTTRPPAFSSALALALDGESRADVLLDNADVAYLLAFRDADDIPPPNRADVALMLREGHLTLWPDATLRPRQTLARARAIYTVAHALEARGLFTLQKATARPSANGTLIVRSAKGADRALALAADAYLFRAFGDTLYPARTVALVGGEPVSYHTDARGAVDYLAAHLPPNGAAADRFSPFANWTTILSTAEVGNRLARSIGRVGAITDLRVLARGVSRRVLDLEVTGTTGTAHVRGGRIRSALGLREQLFVVDRRFDDAGRLTGFTFTGRGWGHGVGMCQVGAYGLARVGWSYDKILQHYYTGIELTKMY
jgi:stage II sporulation protein D